MTNSFMHQCSPTTRSFNYLSFLELRNVSNIVVLYSTAYDNVNKHHVLSWIDIKSKSSDLAHAQPSQKFPPMLYGKEKNLIYLLRIFDNDKFIYAPMFAYNKVI